MKFFLKYGLRAGSYIFLSVWDSGNTFKVSV